MGAAPTPGAPYSSTVMPPYLGPQPLHLIPPKLALLNRDLAAPQSRSVTSGSCLTPEAPHQDPSTPKKAPLWAVPVPCAEGKHGGSALMGTAGG